MVKIVVCGDFRALYPERIKVDDTVSRILDSVDIRVCNFEAPILTSVPQATLKSGPSLYQSPQSSEFLSKNGFDVLLLANNHIMDYGESGLRTTIESFSGKLTVGAGTAAEAYSVKTIDINGKRIGFLSLVHHEYGVLEGIKDPGIGAAWICSPDVTNIIRDAHTQCDILIVLPHAGVEHSAAPLPQWRLLYKKFIDWGADAVIASHPHCPQGWEWYKDKPIYYSLGNFYFDGLGNDTLWYKSIAVELCIDDGLSTKEHFLCFEKKTCLISVDADPDIKEYLDKANMLLQDEVSYKKYLDSLCNAFWPDLEYGILRSLGGVSLEMGFKKFFRLLGCMLLGNKNKLYLHNAMQCESHRWLIEHYLSNNCNKYNK